MKVEQHKEALAAYDTSNGTIRFPVNAPPPESLVRMLVESRIAEIDATTARKRKS
mgnify:CR=1 FL=1